MTPAPKPELLTMRDVLRDCRAAAREAAWSAASKNAFLDADRLEVHATEVRLAGSK